MRSRYGSRRPRRARRTRRPRRTIKKVIRKHKRTVFRKRVKSIIQSIAEVKHISSRGTKTFSPLRSGAGSYGSNIFYMTPSPASVPFGGCNIGIGSQDGQREGNKVQIKKAMFNIALSTLPYNGTVNPTPQPQVVRLYFFKTKVNQTTAPAVGDLCGATGNFFQDGTGSTGFIGSLADINMHMNTDRYTYLGSRTCKLGYQQYGGSGGNMGAQWFGNNDYKMNYVRRINITKMIPKTLSFDDTGAGTTPQVYALFQVVNSDGTTAAVTETPVQCIYEQYYEYTDI